LDRSSIGLRVDYSFKITQHNRDLILLERIKEVFKEGTIKSRKIKDASDFSIIRINSLTTIVIPLSALQFNKFQLYGKKAYDFECWKEGIIKI